MRKALKVFTVVGALCVVIAVGWYGFLFLSYVSSSPFDNRPFDQESWIKNFDNQNPDNPRAEMISDLMKNYLKTDMTRSEVIKLLGKPDRRDEKHFISYLIGMQGFVSDPGQLELEFSDEKKLVKYYLIEK